MGGHGHKPRKAWGCQKLQEGMKNPVLEPPGGRGGGRCLPPPPRLCPDFRLPTSSAVKQ